MKFPALFQNLGWKLLAVAIALMLWAAFISSPALVTFVSAPPPPAATLEALDYDNATGTLTLSLAGAPADDSCLT